MEKIIELTLRPNGKIVSTESTNEQTLGMQGENGAAKIRLHLPANAFDFHHYLEFLAPSGDSKSSEPLERVIIDDQQQDYIELLLVEPFIGEYGRYAMQYVGRVESSNRCIKSDIVRLEVEESICAANNMEDTNPDWIAWATRQFQNFEARIAALEQDEHSEVKADEDFGEDETVLISDGAGKKVKGSLKKIKDIVNDAALLGFISLERLAHYLFKISFDKIPTYKELQNDTAFGGCTSFVKDGKLYRNFDFKYDNTAQFEVITEHFIGMASILGLNDQNLEDKEIVSQLPYHVVDGRNENGIMVSTHMLFNDFGYTGSGLRDFSITRVPYEILSRVKSISTIQQDLSGVFANIKIPSQLNGYLLQFVVTDGTNTVVIAPPTSASGSWEFIDATSNPKLANFRYVNRAIVSRSDIDLQLRPTGIERYNLIGENTKLSDLRFSLGYESNGRLSEFIGINNTTKNSTDAELQAIYEVAHQEYVSRQRDGKTWHTVYSVVYSSNGIDHLWSQENYDMDFVQDVDVERRRAESAERNLDQTKQDKLTPDSVVTIKKLIGGLEILTTAPTANNPDGIKIVLLPVEPEQTYQGYLYIFEN